MMVNHLIPYLMMFVMIVTNSFVIYQFNKRRRVLDVSVPAEAAQAKKLKLITLLLYGQMVVFTAFIWLILAPLLAPCVPTPQAPGSAQSSGKC